MVITFPHTCFSGISSAKKNPWCPDPETLVMACTVSCTDDASCGDRVCCEGSSAACAGGVPYGCIGQCVTT